MKQNRITRLFATLLSGVLLAQSAHATLILTEQFLNYNTGNLGASGTGGTGIIPGWNNPQAQVTVTNGSHSLDGTPLGLVSSAGDKVFISGTSNIIAGAFGCYNKFVNPSNFLPSVTTNIYYSFLYQFNLGTDVPTNGVPIAQVNRENSGFATGVHWQLIAKRTGSTIQLGIFKALGTVTNYSSTAITVGQPFFVVVRQQIITGAGNDEDDLWINPAPANFGVAEVSVPTPDASTTNGTEDTSNTGPGRFWVGGSGVNANLDELRIATTWAEATPPVGQCIPAAIASGGDPTNVAQVAEIGATFSVTALGTSPTYQWQEKPAGGGSFTNITDATTATYSTPNLALATDNGDQFRAIVSTSCGTPVSATSAVATVTLTAPIPTTPGLIVYDNFSDLIRDNTPVSTNNSIWRTSDVSADLDASGGAGMVLTPISAKSTLILGQFIDESASNEPPVHLAVGSQIQVTLPFTPSSYNAFTNNSSVRFGLFDYADGGYNFPTADTFGGGGSGGNGQGVRGYMLSLDFGPTFSTSSPLSLYVRNGLSDLNLEGTTGDFLSLTSGPSGGGLTGLSAFPAGQTDTLIMTVNRTDVNAVTFGVTIERQPPLTNLTFSVTETNFAYHRFDAFAVRDNSLETAPDMFTFPSFLVEVDQTTVPVSPFNITSITMPTTNSVVITWASVSGANYTVESSPALAPAAWVTNATVTASGASTSYTNTPLTGTAQFYRVVSP